MVEEWCTSVLAEVSRCDTPVIRTRGEGVYQFRRRMQHRFAVSSERHKPTPPCWLTRLCAPSLRRHRTDHRAQRAVAEIQAWCICPRGREFCLLATHAHTEVYPAAPSCRPVATTFLRDTVPTWALLTFMSGTATPSRLPTWRCECFLQVFRPLEG